MSLQITRSTKEHTWDIPKHLIYKNEIKSEGDKLSLLQTELINLNKKIAGLEGDVPEAISSKQNILIDKESFYIAEIKKILEPLESCSLKYRKPGDREVINIARTWVKNGKIEFTEDEQLGLAFEFCEGYIIGWNNICDDDGAVFEFTKDEFGKMFPSDIKIAFTMDILIPLFGLQFDTSIESVDKGTDLKN